MDPNPPSPSFDPSRPQVRHIDIDEDRDGQRIDNFLITQLKGVPKSRIYRLLRKGEVRVNKGRVKADNKLISGDRVRLPPIRVSEAKKTVIPGERLRQLLVDAILYEDDKLLVINKPSGVAVHGGSGIDLGVIEILRHQFQSPRWELVHRLDRETSGCLLIAKRRSALRNLQQQFRDKNTGKTYLCLVGGEWPRECREISLALKKNQLQSGERIVKVDPSGKPAITKFMVVENFANASLMEVDLITGRTHQIRVHTQARGHAIVGDDKYGNDEVNKAFKKIGCKRLFLHAYRLQFNLPAEDGKLGPRQFIEAPLSEDLQSVLDKL